MTFYVWVYDPDETEGEFRLTDACLTYYEIRQCDSDYIVASFPIPEEGWHLIRQWQTFTDDDNQVLSGVLADYLTDHRSELLTGPSDPAGRLDQLIEYLRGRFRSQFEKE